jgi:hypothetical protein
MAAVALTLGAVDIFVLGSTGGLTAVAIFGSTYKNIQKYLDSAKLIDYLPANTSALNRQLVIPTESVTPMEPWSEPVSLVFFFS